MSETPKLWLCHRNGIMVESEKFGEYIRLTDYRQLERQHSLTSAQLLGMGKINKELRDELTQAQARCA